MEIHALWNRIDQLEKLLISQAKEIDTLRRVVNATQVSLQTLTHQKQQQQAPKLANSNSNNNINSTVTLQIQKPTFLGNYNQQQQQLLNNNRNSVQLSSISKSSQNGRVNISNKQSTFHQPTYLMNSFVHPAIAIPPTLVPSNTRPNMETLNASSRATSTIPLANYNSTTPSTRWSAAPNLRLLDNIVDKDTDLYLNRDLTGTQHQRHRRQSFVEILTCFCPCFSMC